MRPLDRIDIALLRLLQKNGRLSNKELAAQVGVAQSTCLERVRRLVADRVLTGFHGTADPRALGVGLQALVSVQLKRHSREQVEAFRSHALGLPEVLRLTHTAGANDFLLHVAAHDTDHLRDMTLTAFTTRPEVARIETSLIFEDVRKYELPVYVEPED